MFAALRNHWLIRYIAKSEIRVALFFFSIIAALAASLFETLSLALLLPLLKGLITGDFRFVMDLPVFNEITARLPSHFPLGNRNFIVMLVAVTFVAVLGKAFCQYISSRILHGIVRNFENRLRLLVFERFLGLGKLFFDRSSPGHLQQILVGYTQLLAGSLYGLQGVLFASFTLIAYLALMAYISWELTIIVIAIFPALHFSLSRIIHGIRTSSSKFTDSFNALSIDLSNSLGAIPLIKAYSSEQQEIASFRTNSQQVEQMQNEIDKRTLLSAPVQEIISLLFLLLIVAVICLMLTNDSEWSVAEYMVFLVILRRCATSFGVFNQMRSSFATVSGAVEELDKLFDDSDKPFIYSGEDEFSGLVSEIEIKELSYQYPGGVQALSNLNLRIPKGKVVALVGQSGAGKSTLVHLLMRYYDPPARQIFADGVDIREYSLDSWRRQIAFIAQDSIMFNASLRENIVYGLDEPPDEVRLRAILDDAHLTQLLEKLPQGLDTQIGERGVKISGGEKQRVSIARAIAKNAQILLLDEATSALDSETEQEVQTALSRLMKNRTSIVIAHRLSTIKNADQIVVLRDGANLEQGTFDELRKRGEQFSELWNKQTMLA